jgi:hypothetical protein
MPIVDPGSIWKVDSARDHAKAKFSNSFDPKEPLAIVWPIDSLPIEATLEGLQVKSLFADGSRSRRKGIGPGDFKVEQ